MLIMKKFYTSFKSKSLVLLLSTSLLSNAVLAQSLCGPIVETFNNTSGSTAGFTGDFVLGNSGGDGVLIKSRPIATAVYTVTTPTYTLPAGTNFIGYGFDLDGTERIARVEAAISYVSTLNGEITTIFLAQFVPSYNPGATNADVCRAIATSDLPGFPAGGSYRFRFEFTPNTGGGLTTQNITFDDFRTNGTLAQAPLPVTFIGFDAKKLSNGSQLTWKVGGEINVNRYEIERSTDGRNFTSVGSVSSDKKDTYTYFDATTNSTVYYRVKNVDNDGKFKYSTIVRIVNGKSSIILKAFPQPVLGQLTIQHPVINNNSLITVSAADGRLIRSVRPTTGSMQTFVDMSNFKGGLYLVRFDAGDGEVETMKVVKQ